jgi:eukaryotic-like serine/threonine-protein kinase
MVEPIRGADFQIRGLLLALRAGEPLRIARALAMEAGHRSSGGVAAAQQVASLLSVSSALADRLRSPNTHGLIKLVRGVAAVMLGQWKSARTLLDEAEQIFRNYCSGVAWERNTAHDFSLWTLLQIGDVAELKARWAVLYREAQERGDLSAATVLSTLYMTMIKLAGNERLDHEGELESTIARRKRGGFNLHHSAAVLALVHLYLYRGEVGTAYLRVNEFWSDYSRAGLLRVQMMRIQMLELHARTALAMAEKANSPAHYLRQARLDARRLAREQQTWALAHSHYVRSGIAACMEDPVRAAEELTWASEKYELADMPLRAHLMRYRLAEIQNQPESRALRASAELQIRERGVVSPVRWAGMFAPGFAKISTESSETTF